MDLNILPIATLTQYQGSKGGSPANFFRKVGTWVKNNPWKAALVGIATIAVLTVIFSKKVRNWLFGKKTPQAQLTGVRKRKKRK